MSGVRVFARSGGGASAGGPACASDSVARRLGRCTPGWSGCRARGRAATLPCLEDHHLVHEVPRQAVRRGDDHHVDLGPSHVIPQRIQTGPLQAGAAVAVVAVDVLLAQRPLRTAADKGPQQAHLLLDRLGLLLPIRRDARITRYSHPALLPDRVTQTLPRPARADRRGPTAPG